MKNSVAVTEIFCYPCRALRLFINVAKILVISVLFLTVDWTPLWRISLYNKEKFQFQTDYD